MNSPTRYIEAKDKKRIIWAVDPLQSPQEAKKMFLEMKILAKRLNCQIQPVAVFSQSTDDYYIKLTTLRDKGIESFAYKTLNAYLKKANVKNLLPSHVVYSRKLSNREMAVTLSEYAEKTNAFIIFANTRAKKTWNPFRLGGFSETLVATSQVPVLLLNQSAVTKNKVSSILFPTNFSRESKTALESLAMMAKPLKSKIVLFNQVENPNLFVPSYAEFSMAVDWETMQKDAEKATAKDLKKMADQISSDGVKCESIVQRQKKSLAKEILELASKQNVDLIALSSHQGRLSQALLGGTARDILLQAKCPVLVFHRPRPARSQLKAHTDRPVPRNKIRKDATIETPQVTT